MTDDCVPTVIYTVGLALALIAVVSAPVWAGPFVLGVIAWLIHL